MSGNKLQILIKTHYGYPEMALQVVKIAFRWSEGSQTVKNDLLVILTVSPSAVNRSDFLKMTLLGPCDLGIEWRVNSCLLQTTCSKSEMRNTLERQKFIQNKVKLLFCILYNITVQDMG